MRKTATAVSVRNGGLSKTHQGRARVLFVNNAPFIGGAQLNIRHLIRVMDRQKFEPFVVIPDDRLELAPFFAELETAVIGIPMGQLTPLTWRSPADLIHTVRALTRVVREYRIDLIHSHMARAGVVVPPVKWATRVRFVWHLCDGASSRIVGPLTRFADCCTCVSRFVLNQFQDGSRGNVRLLYTGVWVDDLSLEQLSSAKQAVRRELGLADGTPVVGVVANLQFWKGVHVVIRAMAEVVEAHPRAMLVHVGGPVSGYEAYEQEVKRMIRDLQLGDHVKLLGYQPNALQFYPAFDVFVHSPVFEQRCTEAFGHSIVEAMAHRLPVVTSGIGGPAEIVQEGVTGELVAAGDHSALSRQIIRMLDDPVRRHDMGEAGYTRYRAFFTQEREEREYEALYAELLGRPALAPSGEVVKSECIK